MVRTRNVVSIASRFLLLCVDTSAFSSGDISSRRGGITKVARTRELLEATACCPPPSRRPCSLAVSNLNIMSWRRRGDKSFTSCLLSARNLNDGAAGEMAGTAHRSSIDVNYLRAVTDADGGLGYSRYARARSAVQEKEASPARKKPAGILQRIAITASGQQSAETSQFSASSAPTRLALPSDPIERFSVKYKLEGNNAARGKHPASQATSSPASSGEFTTSSKSSPPLGFNEPAGATSTSLVGRFVSELRSRTFVRDDHDQRPRHPQPSDGHLGQQQPGRWGNGGVKKLVSEAAGVEQRLSLESSEASQLKVRDRYAHPE